MTAPGFVRVHHPDLDASADVPAAALSTYRSRGWETITPDTTETEPVPDDPKADIE